MTLTLTEFHNALRILRDIDFHELKHAGVLREDFSSFQQWTRFRADPVGYFIEASDEAAQGIWSVIVDRQPKEGRHG